LRKAHSGKCAVGGSKNWPLMFERVIFCLVARRGPFMPDISSIAVLASRWRKIGANAEKRA
jgi:hypothetical protein